MLKTYLQETREIVQLTTTKRFAAIKFGISDVCKKKKIEKRKVKYVIIKVNKTKKHVSRTLANAT